MLSPCACGWAHAGQMPTHVMTMARESVLRTRRLPSGFWWPSSGMAEQGIMKIPNWEPLSQFIDNRSMPILQKSDFQITFPSGADTLPFTQKFLDAMAEKLSSVPEELRAEWEQVMKDHNALYNKAYDGSKRQAEGGTPEPMMRGVTP